MDNDFSAYMQRVQPVGEATGERAGHRIASALLSFGMGMYDRAAERCEQTAETLGERESTRSVVVALRILREQALSMVATQVSVRSEFTFDGAEEGASVKDEGERAPEGLAFEEEDRAILALSQADEETASPRVAARDNALFLLYAVACTASPDDAQALEEQVYPLVSARFEYYRAES